MITETENVNGLVALMALFSGCEGDWIVVEKNGELHILPAEKEAVG